MTKENEGLKRYRLMVKYRVLNQLYTSLADSYASGATALDILVKMGWKTTDFTCDNAQSPEEYLHTLIENAVDEFSEGDFPAILWAMRREFEVYTPHEGMMARPDRTTPFFLREEPVVQSEDQTDD